MQGFLVSGVSRYTQDSGHLDKPAPAHFSSEAEASCPGFTIRRSHDSFIRQEIVEVPSDSVLDLPVIRRPYHSMNLIHRLFRDILDRGLIVTPCCTAGASICQNDLSSWHFPRPILRCWDTEKAGNIFPYPAAGLSWPAPVLGDWDSQAPWELKEKLWGASLFSCMTVQFAGNHQLAAVWRTSVLARASWCINQTIPCFCQCDASFPNWRRSSEGKRPFYRSHDWYCASCNGRVSSVKISEPPSYRTSEGLHTRNLPEQFI